MRTRTRARFDLRYLRDQSFLAGFSGRSFGGFVAVEASVAVWTVGSKIEKNYTDNKGNAADAAVATILALNVTDHGDCSIGGEVPVLIHFGADRQEGRTLIRLKQPEEQAPQP